MKNPQLAVLVIIIILATSIIAAGTYLSAQTNPQPSFSPSLTSTPPSTSQKTVTVNGAGATFPQPLLSAIIAKYTTEIKQEVQVNYEGVGSGTGITNLQSKTIDFAGTDAPLSASDMVKAPNTLHIPETIGAVALAYNLPGISSGVHLTGEVIADIFLGKITIWNDNAIQSMNPDLELPQKPIQIVHRSESSGTTFIFTGFLSLSSDDWNNSIGQGKKVAWPIGIGANGNPGVASVVEGTQYMLGYVELAHALQKNMSVAAVQNPAGYWVIPNLSSTQEAVRSGASAGLPEGDQSWTSVTLINSPGDEAYPIVSFSYLLTYQELNIIPGMTQEKASALVQFLWWIVHDGQDLAPSLKYAMLPPNVVQINEDTIRSITFNGQNLPTS